MLRPAQKLANRVGAGVLIAVIIAAALFSGNKGSTLVWGYPVLSIVFLGLAIIVAASMGLRILRGDLAAEQPTPYPPGIPGERINQAVVDYLRSVLAAGMVIPDAKDPTLDTFRVVD